jgi:hypothetical protein
MNILQAAGDPIADPVSRGANRAHEGEPEPPFEYMALLHWRASGLRQGDVAVREDWLESESAASAAGIKLRRQKERRGYRAL